MTNLITNTTVTLTVRGHAKVGGRLVQPVSWTDDPNISLEALGVVTWLVAHSGTHTVGELADRFGYHPDTMSRIVDELETHSTVQYVDLQVGGAV